MMKTIQARITIVFIGLIAMVLGIIWGVNRWYLEDFYVSQKVKSLNTAYSAIDWQIEENAKHGISIERAMRREQDANGNISEGNLQRLIRDFSDSANVSVLMIDNSAAEATVYSTSRDTKFLKDRMDRYIFGWNQAKFTMIEENAQYKIQKTFDPGRDGMYLESWGFFSDNSTAFIMSTPLSSIGESVRLSNRFLAYVGFLAVSAATVVAFILTKRITKPIYRLSSLSEKMSRLDFDVRYEPSRREMKEIEILGSSINTLSERLKETIGELKSANNQLTKDIEEKTKIDEMRKEFIANVSHELKTPIALIQGYAEGLQEGMGEDKESRDYYCEVIVDEAGKMNQMVKQLLTLSSLESGNDRTVMERFDMTELIRGVVGASQILLQQNEISVDFDDSTPVYVWADEFKMEQVVTNYLSNAIHHAEGEKKIVIRMKQEEERVRISVFNTGTPIPEESLPVLWTKFYKVDKARTRSYGGTGVGLSIVKAIIDAHNQQCGVENRENGVEFWFTVDGSNRT